MPGVGDLPPLDRGASPTRYYGYEDEVVAGVTPSAALILQLLRPAREWNECAEMLNNLLEAEPGLSAPSHPLMPIGHSEGRIQVGSAAALRRDGFLLAALFDLPGLPASFVGFDRLWFGFEEAASEARLTRFEAPYLRFIITTGPARAGDRDYFARERGMIRLDQLLSGRRLSVVIESDQELAVSESDVRAWIGRSLGR